MSLAFQGMNDITVLVADQATGGVRFMAKAKASGRKGTGPKPASDAGELLRDPKTPRGVKDVAASDLAQAPRRPKKGKK
jgi:hypothetical protein